MTPDPSPSGSHPQDRSVDLWIIPDPYGTHADVRVAPEDGGAPAGAHVLRPGGSLYLVRYEAWLASAGQTVDILHLQLREHPVRVPESLEPAGYRVGADDGDRRVHPAVPGDPAHGDWRSDPAVTGDPPQWSEYGYCGGERCIPCSREELVAQLAADPLIPRVWTPEAPGLVKPEEVPFLVEACRGRVLAKSRKRLRLHAVLLVVSIVVLHLLLPELWYRSLLVLVPGLLAVSVAGAVHDLVGARRAGPEIFPEARQAARHAAWAGEQSRTYTYWILGCLIAVMVAQMLGGRREAIEAAGLVKPRVWAGEAWRLLTGPVLHASVTHLWLNATALLAVGPLVEIHSRRSYLPLAFLASALGGSLLSLLFLPHATSVGASGGIMGIIGFLGVLGLRRRDHLPPGFLRAIVFSTVATGVLGVVGFALIDNAAHFGGLAAGALLGTWLVRDDPEPDPRVGTTDWPGRVGLAAVAAAALLALVRIFPLIVD